MNANGGGNLATFACPAAGTLQLAPSNHRYSRGCELAGRHGSSSLHGGDGAVVPVAAAAVGGGVDGGRGVNGARED